MYRWHSDGVSAYTHTHTPTRTNKMLIKTIKTNSIWQSYKISNKYRKSME